MFEHNKKQELTSRQKQILSLLRKGLTNIEICKTLGISANTVKVHLANIYKTLEVTNRTEAVSSEIDTERRTDDIKKDLNIIFFRPDNISAYSKANGLYHSVVESLQQYRIFRIMVNRHFCSKRRRRDTVHINQARLLARDYLGEYGPD